MPREKGESGEFVETLAPEDVLDVFDTVDGPVILSADVADHFGVSRQTARRKLNQLSDRGVLDRRKVSRRVIYWRADREGFDAADLQGDATTTLADTDTDADARTVGGGNTTNAPAENGTAESDHTRDERAGRLTSGRCRLTVIYPSHVGSSSKNGSGTLPPTTTVFQNPTSMTGGPTSASAKPGIIRGRSRKRSQSRR